VFRGVAAGRSLTSFGGGRNQFRPKIARRDDRKRKLVLFEIDRRGVPLGPATDRADRRREAGP